MDWQKHSILQSETNICFCENDASVHEKRKL